MSTTALTIAIALAAGVTSQALARHLRVPSIVILLAAGVALGPEVAGLVQPAGLGEALVTLVSLGVAIILFEGALNLRIDRLRRSAVAIRRVISVGAGITAALSALTAGLILGWGAETSILFGILAASTGPTVITPILRRTRVNKRVQMVLESEGVMVDPLSAIFAVVAIELFLSTDGAGIAMSLLGMPLRLVAGAAIGVAGGLLLSYLLRHDRWVPDDLENIFTLSLVLCLFEVSNVLVPDSGLLAVALAGLVVGNSSVAIRQELREFKEQMTTLLIGMIFVLLAADIGIGEVASLGMGAVWVVAVMIVAIRPLAVLVATRGTDLNLRERLFIAWLGPRGIVAIIMATLFAERLYAAGHEDALGLRALVLLMIAMTVVIQGGFGPLMATLLRIRRPTDNGYLVVGANPLGRVLARALARGGQETVVLDSNATEIGIAEEQGLRVVFGNANDERPMLRADVEGRRAVVAVTANAGKNLLVARSTRARYKMETVYAALDRARTDIGADDAASDDTRVLFAQPVDLELWNHRILHETAAVDVWRWNGGEEAGAATSLPTDMPDTMVPLTARSSQGTAPVFGATRFATGDEVSVLVALDSMETVQARLVAEGWTRVRKLEVAPDERRDGPTRATAV